MKVLIVKLTSMGDVLHVMPAISDLCDHHSIAQVDWLVEDNFADICAWHPKVGTVISAATRRWRNLTWTSISEFLSLIKTLRSERYDVVIDAQGLIKSALLARLTKLTKSGYRAGFSGDSIKESPAALLYQKKISVTREQHAIERLRQLFAGCFGYSINHDNAKRPDYGINRSAFASHEKNNNKPSIMLFHGTTWPSKHLPDTIWRELADVIAEDGYQIKLSWGNELERQRAQWVAVQRPHVTVLEKSSLNDIATELSASSGAIAVDTGLGHMAAALAIPCVSVYGSTNAKLTGAIGNNQLQLQSDYPCSPCLLRHCDKLTNQVKDPPCYQSLDAASIWQILHSQIA